MVTKENININNNKDSKIKRDMSRCYPNNSLLPESSEEQEKYIDQCKEKIKKYLFNDLIKKISPPNTDRKVNSLNKLKYDPFIYTGSGGNTYSYWRFYLLNKNLKIKDVETEYNSDTISKDYNFSNTKSFINFETATNIHYSILECEEKTNKNAFYSLPPSFYLGPPGILAMKLILEIEKQQNNIKINNNTSKKQSNSQSITNLSSIKTIIEKIINFKKVALSTKTEQEVLYGYSGYLWTLLFTSKILQKNNIEIDLSNHITDMFFHIIKEGNNNQVEYKTKCLTYLFPSNSIPKSNEDFYLGAAHGILGSLYVLIKTMIMFDTYLLRFKEYKQCVRVIEQSLDYILTLQFESGNFPSSLGKEKDNKLHFCHGSCGAIMVYIEAYKLYKKKEYWDCVIKAGEDLWLRGIILKGNCICHGILGSVYSMCSLFKLTNDKKWLVRAYDLALNVFNKDVQASVLSMDDKQRKVKGIPDSPFSLMEGNGGEFTLLSDLLSEDIFFPGFEL